ncbi:cytochrome c4 [Halorhodospira halochloris]|uniref:Cytochrome c4 n=1 Tax=Halorhodospira halochloris TaxID=1052 RepID=A0A0X8X7V7_HALHR|nr:c-type cytochrome [Halorhodospira halochloris]MBK1650860.1 hypothetical protein [Halorhodospira halochloris]MCG5530299.1 cytochrome c4 [Halorhodospira halochloris]MCG5547214.1 cytochrome c4 [Halorhodospira halochloris]BAU56642.1 cytochrome c4 [Halorhodospira halochloris]
MYHRIQIVTAVTAFALAAGAAGASEVDLEAAEQLNEDSCVACHGATGVSDVAEWPSIAGQHADYVRYHLEMFRDEERYDPQGLMTPESVGLSDEDIENLAAFFVKQDPPPAQDVDEELAERGERIYFGGIRESNVASCTGCHGPQGKGVEGALYPRVAGQEQQYMIDAMKGYKSGDRDSDRNSEMRDIASRMSEEDIEAVAAFMSSLGPDRDD